MFPIGSVDKNYIKENRGFSKQEIVAFFANEISLLLKRSDRYITIVCHLLARKNNGRETGFYIEYTDHYSSEIFEKFKINGEKALKEIGFELFDIEESNTIQYNNVLFKNNVVFKNISIFDLWKKYSTRDEYELFVLKKKLKNGYKIPYSGGNLFEISGLVGSLLNNIDNMNQFDLCISSKECMVCNINIQTNFEGSELNLAGVYREKIEKEVKDKRNEDIENRACEGLKIAVGQLHSCGWNDLKITNYLFKNCFSLEPPTNKYIQTLVESAYYLDTPYRSSSDNSGLTNNFITLFREPEFKSMLDWELIKNEFIKPCSQSMELANNSRTESEKEKPKSWRETAKTEIDKIYYFIKEFPREILKSCKKHYLEIIIVCVFIFVLFILYTQTSLGNWVNGLKQEFTNVILNIDFLKAN